MPSLVAQTQIGNDTFNSSALAAATGIGGDSTFFELQRPSTGGAWDFAGSGFANYVNGLATTGTLSSLTYSRFGVAQVVYSNAALDMAVIAPLIMSGNATGLATYLLSGDDIIAGGAGVDFINGYAGNDTIHGGDENDIIVGGAGIDVMFGDNGFDEITADTAGDTVDGGAGIDLLHFNRSSLTSGVSLSLTGMNTGAGVTLFDGTIVRNTEGFDVKTGSGDDTISFTGPIVGGATIDAGAGEDWVVLDLSSMTSGIVSSSLPLLNVEHFNITAGSGNDTLLGGGFADTLNGGAGADSLEGKGGDDVLNGGAGSDILRDIAGVNVMNGGDGDDDFYSTQSSIDTIDGGAGVDRIVWLDRSSSSANFAISLAAMGTSAGLTLPDGTVIRNVETFGQIQTGSGTDVFTIDIPLNRNDYVLDADAGVDRAIADLSWSSAGFTLQSGLIISSGVLVRLWNFEQYFITGSGAGDTFYGDSGDDALSGAGGNDTLTGGLGNDALDGGAGFDTASYIGLMGVPGANAGVVVSLAISGPQNTGGGGIDTLSNFEALVGTDFADVLTAAAGGSSLTGLGGDDYLYGGDGNDTLNGGAGGDFLNGGAGGDVLDCGDGFDVVSWQLELSGLTLNLANQAQNAGSAAGDTVANVEVFYLTSFADTLTASSSGEFIYSFEGNDTIAGSSASDIIDGGAGSDAINAGGGFDYVSWYSSSTGITVDLKTPSNNTGVAAGDTITNAEAFILTSGADTFVGTDSGQNIAFGYEGNDTMIGGFNANNWFFAGDGNDRMVGGGVQDLYVGGAGVDTIVPATPTPIAGSSVFGFEIGGDKLEISRSLFGLSGSYAISAGATFVSGTSPVATSTDPTFFYYTNFGLLYFDPDGTGSTPAALLMQLAGNPTLTAADFLLVG